jgi:putative membrane protein
MIHRQRSLSTLSAIAVAVGLAACGGGSHQTQANAPAQGAASQPSPTNEQYGAAMGQPGATTPGTEMGPAYGSQSQPGPGAPGSTSSQSTGSETGGAYGPSQYGTGPSGTTTTPPGMTGGTTGSQGMTGGTTGSQGTMGAPSTMGGTSGAGSAMGAGSTDVSSFDDAQLAAVVQSLNMSEMQTAQLAQSKATSPEVKKYAKDMMTQHREMENRANAVFSRLQITPNENAVSNQVKTDAQSDMSTLQGMRGKDFDREYIDEQVRAHNHALELVDRMIPSAKSPELKAELQGARTKIEAHLRQAEKIQQTQQKGTTNKQRGGTDMSPSTPSTPSTPPTP